MFGKGWETTGWLETVRTLTLLDPDIEILEEESPEPSFKDHQKAKKSFLQTERGIDNLHPRPRYRNIGKGQFYSMGLNNRDQKRKIF